MFPAAILKSSGNSLPRLILPSGEDNVLKVLIPRSESGAVITNDLNCVSRIFPSGTMEFELHLDNIERLANFTAALCARLQYMVDGVNEHLKSIHVPSLQELANGALGKTIDDISVDDLELSVRAYHAVTRGPIGSGCGWLPNDPKWCNTVSDICSKTELDFLLLKDCGKNTIKEIKSVLSKLGRSLSVIPNPQ